MNEVILPCRVRAQPVPAIVPGGDCGACVIGGVVGLTVAAVYDELVGARKALTWLDSHEALSTADALGLVDRVILDTPMWEPVHRSKCFFGTPAWESARPWFDYIRMAIDAGYYGVAFVAFDGTGPMIEPDHVVLICGARERMVAHPTVVGAARIDEEIFVSCSASNPAGEWKNVRDFLRRYGGWNAQLFRPAIP